MKAYDYPDFSEHLKAHGDFKERLAELTNMFAENRATAAESLLEFLMNWLVQHIQKVDVKLADFLKQQGMT